MTIEQAEIAQPLLARAREYLPSSGVAKVQAAYDFAAVIIEADWKTIIKEPPERSKLNPNSVLGTSTSWMIRYGVPWIACPGRRFAEIYTFRLFQQFWKFHIAGK